MKKAGLYIHIPFCIKKCPYCNFYSISDLSLENQFIDSLINEIKHQKKYPYVFDTIYFGGGTPSILESKNVERIIETVFKYLKIDENPEITIEINPATNIRKKIEIYKSLGINRLNIGVQSFFDEELKFLGRAHTVFDTISTIELVEKFKFENVGIDLIYGFLGSRQTKEKWTKNLKKAASFSSIQHISCYSLSYEKNTPFYKKRDNAISEDEELELFRIAIKNLKGYGFFQYEVSNFAKKNRESKHNKKYWNYSNYLGFGPSAHSFDGEKRFWNLSNLKHYLSDKNYKEEEILTETQKKIEAIYLGFRQNRGVDIEFFNKTFKCNFIKDFKSEIEILKNEKLLLLKNNRCYLSEKGLFLLDSICLKFIETM